MKNVYLILAIVGAAIPIYFFMQFFSSDLAADPGFVPSLFANGAAAGFSADLLISSFVFWLFMWARRATGPAPWAFIALNLCIGLSCALPAYLYWSEKTAG